jgi:metal-responsive CopG/Arc/MetJ family transcriptional regulator
MAKRKPRKPGPLPTGITPMIGLRIPDELTVRIDTWADRNTVTRSEAVRRLVVKALEHEETGDDRTIID